LGHLHGTLLSDLSCRETLESNKKLPKKFFLGGPISGLRVRN
jgi:hypothetical protein